MNDFHWTCTWINRFINRVILSAGISSASCILHLHSHCNSWLDQMPTGHEILSLRYELVKILNTPFLHSTWRRKGPKLTEFHKESLTYFETAIQSFVFGSLHSNTRTLESKSSPTSIGINAADPTLTCGHSELLGGSWQDQSIKCFCTITSNKGRPVI